VNAADLDIRKVAAAYPASLDLDDHIGISGTGPIDGIEPDVADAMDIENMTHVFRSLLFNLTSTATGCAY
jgi:hypothetical protein